MFWRSSPSHSSALARHWHRRPCGGPTQTTAWTMGWRALPLPDSRPAVSERFLSERRVHTAQERIYKSSPRRNPSPPWLSYPPPSPASPSSRSTSTMQSSSSPPSPGPMSVSRSSVLSGSPPSPRRSARTQTSPTTSARRPANASPMR